MSKSENSNRATQALRRRGQGVLKKSLDNRRRFIDGLELANAFGVFDPNSSLLNDFKIYPLRRCPGLFRIARILHYNLQYIVAWREVRPESQAPTCADP